MGKTRDGVVAWEYELAQSLSEDGGYGMWTPPLCSHRKPNVPDGAVRNLRPLYYGTEPDVDALTGFAIKAYNEDIASDGEQMLKGRLPYKSAMRKAVEAVLSEVAPSVPEAK